MRGDGPESMRSTKRARLARRGLYALCALGCTIPVVMIAVSTVANVGVPSSLALLLSGCLSGLLGLHLISFRWEVAEVLRESRDEWGPCGDLYSPQGVALSGAIAIVIGGILLYAGTAST